MSSKTSTMAVTNDTQPSPEIAGVSRQGDIVSAGTYRLIVPSDYDTDDIGPDDLLGDPNIRDLGAYPMVIVTDVTPNFGDVARITNDDDVWGDLKDFGDAAEVYELGKDEVQEGHRIRLSTLGDRVSLADI